MSRRIIAILFLLLLTATAAQAAVERFCLVSVKVGTGWSQEHKRRVTFVTGLELSRIGKPSGTTSSLKFELHENYALIWHETGLPIIIRIDEVVVGARQEFTADNFRKFFEHSSERLATQLSGEGRNLKWRIRARTDAGWVDQQM